MLRREIRELSNIANEIDYVTKQARPYSLTFYNREGEITEPITDTQREELEKYLADSFHNIWASSWIIPASARIRKLIEGNPKHS